MKEFATVLVFLTLILQTAFSLSHNPVDFGSLKLEDKFYNNEKPNLLLSPTSRNHTNGTDCYVGNYISTQCGEVLNGHDGAIIYKVSETIPQNERCLWIIRGGTANYFQLTLHYKQYDNNTQLLATCLRNDAPETNVIINETGLVYGIDTCNVVLITFSSGTNFSTNSTGFLIQYKAYQGGNVSRSSRDYFISPSNRTVPLVYPPNLNYGNDEFSTFVFVPNNTIWNASREISIIYSRIQLEGCFDHLKVYKFNSSYQFWEPPRIICDDINSLLINNDDMILMTFKSDSYIEGIGFYLLHSERDQNVCRINERNSMETFIK